MGKELCCQLIHERELDGLHDIALCGRHLKLLHHLHIAARVPLVERLAAREVRQLNLTTAIAAMRPVNLQRKRHADKRL